MKNIVVFSDGTGQDGGVRPEQRISNIYKLYWASRNHPGNAINPHDQVAFYDAGLGTDIGATAITAPVRYYQKLLGSVAGEGIKRNIAECYEFIINHYEAGDRIFLFGFSRGAYTARCIANLLMLCGVPTTTAAGSVMRFRKAVRDIADEAVNTVLEHGAGHPRPMFDAERSELARRFRSKYGSGDDTDSNAAPYFIGVFDTVAALGASGRRRILIRTALGLGVAGAAIMGSLIPAAILAAFFKECWHLGFLGWIGLIVLLAVIAAEIVFWRKQRAAKKKTIYDFPNAGDPPRSHMAEWKGENFDKLLSHHVAYARSANAIDETRKDFDRVGWGPVAGDGSAHGDDEPNFVQKWFAGNHSDVGGSYPEAESRLSDIALAWMVKEATKIDGGLKTGPIFINGDKLPKTGEAGESLHIYPAADGVQHCEIAGMRDTLDAFTAKVPTKFLKRRFAGKNWDVKVRKIAADAPVHTTVEQRFALPFVTQCGGTGAYRPEALKNHDKFKALYPDMSSSP